MRKIKIMLLLTYSLPSTWLLINAMIYEGMEERRLLINVMVCEGLEERKEQGQKDDEM
jgi:predicted outer membrane lipoprotein